jgi:ABC-type bacteriocin/lantibiotic exporter with double-glycine peptidase domain
MTDAAQLVPTTDAVLRRFLHLCGREDDAVAPRCGDATNARVESFAQLVGGLGEAGRVVRLRPSDARALTLPTLVGLKGGGVAVLIAVDRGALALDFGDGVFVRMGRNEARTRLSGEALERHPCAEVQGVTSTVAALASANGPLRRALVQSIALGVLVHIASLAGPFGALLALDQAVPQGARGLLLVAALAVAAASVQRAILGALKDLSADVVSARLEAGLSVAIFARGMARPYADLARESPGALHRRLTAAHDLGAGALARVMDPALRVVAVAAHAALVAALLPAIVPWAAALATLSVALTGGIGLRLASQTRATVTAAERQYHALYEAVAGIETVRVAAAEGMICGRWLDRVRGQLAAALRADTLSALARHVASGLEDLLVATAILWGGRACLDGRATMGAALATVQSCVAIAAAVRALADVPPSLMTMRVSVANLEEVLRAKSEPVRDCAPATPSTEGPVVHLEDVWYRYEEDGPWLFRGFSLAVAPGEHVRLSWPSGAGKSTLLRLIAGLLVPERGTIRVAGAAPRRLRGAICYLPQASALFAGSVLDNIRLLSDGASFERILEAAAATGLGDLIAQWPMQFDTLVLGGGANLSTGQRQLIALTAAIASSRPVLLLDEAAANIDRATRQRMARSGALRGRTVISVAHDVDESR